MENITEKANTIEKILEIVKPTEDQKVLLNYAGTDRKMIGAKNSMLSEMITEVFNEGWLPKYGDRGYFPVFDDSEGGFAFSYSRYGRWRTGSCVGSRHAFKNRSLSDFAGENFTEIFKKKLTK